MLYLILQTKKKEAFQLPSVARPSPDSYRDELGNIDNPTLKYITQKKEAFQLPFVARPSPDSYRDELGNIDNPTLK